MQNEFIADLVANYQEDHTSTTIKRTTNIENCVPDGYFKLIHSVALATNGTDKQQSIAAIRKSFDESNKGSKDVMTNLGYLTAQPFPLVESSKRMSAQSDRYESSPLYDISTGNIVAERYASVGLSELGRLLTRHYLDENIDSLDHYNSIIPASLLRRSMPFALGLKSDMFPLNPKELFQIMIEMMKKKSPIIDGDFLTRTFKGFDLGENYIIFMKPKALIELYSSGMSSFIAIPKINIDFKNSEITFFAPRLTSTSKKLQLHLINRKSKPSTNYKSFSYDLDVKLVGSQVILKVDNWGLSANELKDNEKRLKKEREILNEFLKDNKIAMSTSVKNMTLKYINKNVTLNENSILGEIQKPVKVSELEEMSGLNKEDLFKWDQKKLEKKIKESGALERIKPKNLEAFYIENSGSLRSSKGENANRYPYEIDTIPVYEILWDCIEGEKKLKLKALKKELEALLNKHKKDMIYEKASRAGVNDFIHQNQKLNPLQARLNRLVEQFPEGSELVPEGFTLEEAQEIYKYRGNDIIARLFDYDHFKEELENTREKIKALQSKIDDPDHINKDIIRELERLVNSGKYDRKSQVFFLKEARMTDFKPIEKNQTWDMLDLPVTLYYSNDRIIRNYGVNKYFKNFKETWELNTTNMSSVQICYKELIRTEERVFECSIERASEFENEKIEQIDENTIRVTKKVGIYALKTIVRRVNEIPTQYAIQLPSNFVGIIPVQGNVETMIYTNFGAYHKYTTMLKADLELRENEVIAGWITLDKPYIDVLSDNGVQTVDLKKITFFSTKFNNFAGVFTRVLDIVGRDEIDSIVKITNIKLKTSHYEATRKLFRSFDASPLELPFGCFSSFSENITLYIDGMFIREWKWLGRRTEDKYKAVKIPYLKEETVSLQANDETSKKILKKLNLLNRMLEFEEDGYSINNLSFNFSRTTESYKNFDYKNKAFEQMVDERMKGE